MFRWTCFAEVRWRESNDSRVRVLQLHCAAISHSLQFMKLVNKVHHQFSSLMNEYLSRGNDECQHNVFA